MSFLSQKKIYIFFLVLNNFIWNIFVSLYHSKSFTMVLGLFTIGNRFLNNSFGCGALPTKSMLAYEMSLFN